MKILVSALEHSANVHLASLHKELEDTTEFIGIFDCSLGEPIVDLRSLAIMGFVDVFKKIPFFFQLKAQMLELAQDVDTILLLDSSAFNLPLAKAIKKKYPKKKIIYYILPQAWAWRKKRIPVLAKTVDILASILPFEKDYYPSDAPIRYVGHPLLDQIQVQKEKLVPKSPALLFMPGSRKGEIAKLMPIFHKVRAQLNLPSQIAIPEYFSQAQRDEIYGDLDAFEIVHDSHKALYKADFAFICSGTATLEASLIGTPFILAYIAKSLDYFIATKCIKIDEVGLSNIMFRKMHQRAMHPEFLQDAVSEQALLQCYEAYDREQFFTDARELRVYLGHGSAKTLAKMLQS